MISEGICSRCGADINFQEIFHMLQELSGNGDQFGDETFEYGDNFSFCTNCWEQFDKWMSHPPYRVYRV